MATSIDDNAADEKSDKSFGETVNEAAHQVEMAVFSKGRIFDKDKVSI